MVRTIPVRVSKLTVNGDRSLRDTVVVEEPLRVHLRHRTRTHLLGSTMRTPGDDMELAVGLAMGEGVVTQSQQIVDVRPCAGDGRYSPTDVLVTVADDVEVHPQLLGRVSHPSSACGMCGRDQIDELAARVPTCDAQIAVAADILQNLPQQMRERQPVFDKTGGLHAAGLASTDGRLLLVREDIGRHNAVDKVMGRALLDSTPRDVLVVSGRVGFEIVQKAAMARTPIIVAVSAPSSLAVDAARSAGLTLIGFAREGRMTAYAGRERIGR